MENSSSPAFDAFYSACCNNNLEQVHKTINESYINQGDDNGDTVLHIASKRGYTELIELLLERKASQEIKNNEKLVPEQVAMNDEIKTLFKPQMTPKQNSERYIGTTDEIEWIDSYKNAYRIAYENRGHMKQWLLKVPFIKLLEELKTGYIDKMEFPSAETTKQIQEDIEMTIECEQPMGLVWIYTSGTTGFCTKLNYDLAEIGSDFRFLSTQNLFNSGYLDNEPPKDLGQHIFAAILINHPYFQSHYCTGRTYRGMNVTRSELAQYKQDDIVLTRSFLSTSKSENVATIFKADSKNKEQPLNREEKIPITCIYTVINARTALNLKKMSRFETEDEVLIAPFAVFRITKIEDPNKDEQNKNNPVIIHLEEVDSNLV